MTKLDDAKKLWQRKQAQYRKTTKLRTAYTGDGRGTAESNFYYQYGGNNQYIWVRTPDSLDKPFPVLNRGAVRPGFNIPVWLGTTEIEPKREQVLGINYDAYGAIGDGTGGVDGIGAHHDQHEWQGGDEVFLDPRQVNYALVHPTNPASMQLEIDSFYYFHGDSWYQVDAQTLSTLSPYVPSTGNARYVLISYDPVGQQIVYTAGDPFNPGSFQFLLDNPNTIQAYLPAPSHNYFPLGFVVLRSTTTSLNWDTELADGRRHINTGMTTTRVGEVMVSVPGGYFEPLIPVTDTLLGQQLIDENTGYLLYS